MYPASMLRAKVAHLWMCIDVYSQMGEKLINSIADTGWVA
jgi:hypothetical protein